MGRASTKENKNKYQLVREELGLSREHAGELLERLASLNAANKEKDRLIEIAADGRISNDEIDDFIFIQEELERISITGETLQLWAERMLANGVIDAEAYNTRKNK